VSATSQSITDTLAIDTYAPKGPVHARLTGDGAASDGISTEISPDTPGPCIKCMAETALSSRSGIDQLCIDAIGGETFPSSTAMYAERVRPDRDGNGCAGNFPRAKHIWRWDDEAAKYAA